MAHYSLALRTSGTAQGIAVWELRAAATNSPRIIEIGMVASSAAGSSLRLGRAVAQGITPTSPQNFVSEEAAGSPTSQTTAAVAWGTAPVVPNAFLSQG